MIAWFSQFDYRELNELGSGLPELLLLALLFFVVVLPAFVVRAVFRRRALKTAEVDAIDFATRASIVAFIVLPICILAIVLPFGILNVLGLVVFDQQFYWPLIAPGLLVVHGLEIAFVWLLVWNDLKQKKRPTEKQRRKAMIRVEQINRYGSDQRR